MAESTKKERDYFCDKKIALTAKLEKMEVLLKGLKPYISSYVCEGKRSYTLSTNPYSVTWEEHQNILRNLAEAIKETP